MEERRDSPPGTDSESVEVDSESFIDRHFWSILLGAVLLAAGASTVVVYAQYSQVDQTLRPYVDRAQPYVEQAAQALPYLSPDSSSGEEYGTFTKMENLVVNPAESGGGRYLAVSIAFESKSNDVKGEVEEKKVVIKDAILALLSEQTAEELSTPSRRDTLKKELKQETNRILNDGTVDELYFTEFVLQ